MHVKICFCVYMNVYSPFDQDVSLQNVTGRDGRRRGRVGLGRGGHTIDLWIKATSMYLKICSIPLQRGATCSNDVDSSLIHVYTSSCVHNNQRDKGLQRDLHYAKAVRKCLNNVA